MKTKDAVISVSLIELRHPAVAQNPMLCAALKIKQMEKRFEVSPPIMPNFVRFKQEAGLRQDGFKVDNGFDIADFTQQEAEEFADLMRQTFMEHYAKRKASKSALREITE